MSDLTDELKKKAWGNLESLRHNSYPGRGIVIGLNSQGTQVVQVYWIMGRSENSRNRVFSHNGGRVFTEAADPARVKDPNLIFYNAMDECLGYYAVSNGNQTDEIMSATCDDYGLIEALDIFTYEPDIPNNTPRIAGVVSLNKGIFFDATMAILRKSPWSAACDRSLYTFGDLPKGYGHCLTTYSGDGDPLPSFRGEPFLLPLVKGIKTVADDLWGALDSQNRVAIAVKFINIETGKSTVRIINQYQKV